MGCIICGSAETRPLYLNVLDRMHPQIPVAYDVHRCEACGLMFIDTTPTQEELNAHYPETYHTYERSVPEMSGIRKWITERVAEQYLGYGESRWWRALLLPFFLKLSHLPTSVENGNILDVGCAQGERMRVFRALGWNAWGVESGATAAQAARDQGFRVSVGPFEEVDLPQGYFHAVHLNHVFEHLRDPHVALKKIRSILRPGGELIIAVPNGNSVAARLYRHFWFALDIPRHPFTYTRASLLRLLGRYGFRTTAVVYSQALGSINVSLAHALGLARDSFHFCERPIWLLNFVVDPVGNMLRVGDAITVRAVLVDDARAGNEEASWRADTRCADDSVRS